MWTAAGKAHGPDRLQLLPQLPNLARRDGAERFVADGQADIEPTGQPLEAAGDVDRVTDDGLFPAGRTEGHHPVVYADADRHGRLAVAQALIVPFGNSIHHGKAAGD